MAKKVSTWNELKKVREAILEIEGVGAVKLRGITERERLKATQDSTKREFDREAKEHKDVLDTDEFGYKLIIAGWVSPKIPGETFEQKIESLKDIGFAILQKIAIRINELSGISMEDISDLKNFSGPA